MSVLDAALAAVGGSWTALVLCALIGWWAISSFILPIVLQRPPAPFALPMLGNLYLLPQPGELPGVHKAMAKLAKKHGPVMGFWFGSQYTVVISSPAAMHEALKVRGDDFAGRFCAPTLNIITKGVGIALQNDLTKWRKARTAALTGMTMKSTVEKHCLPVIMEEVHSMANLFLRMCESGEGGEVDVRMHIGRESLNVVMRSMCNVRFSEKLTPFFRDVRECLEEIFKRISAGNPADYMPLLRMLGPKPKVIGEMENWAGKMYSYIDQWIQEHKNTLDPENPRDFLDRMISQREELGISETDIQVIIWDLMAGGIDTSSTTLEWLFYILCNYPDVQRKMHEELDRVVGPNRLPTYEDREKLPYLQGVLNELMRWKHFAPFGLPHNTLRATTLQGYRIPKNAQVLINFHAIGRDPDAWKDPEKFRPERWLEEEKGIAQYYFEAESQKRDAASFKFVPFGCGKRMCVGYGLGRVVLWCKVATHVHCFDWASSTGKPLNIDDEHFGVTVLPELAKVRITPRPAARLCANCEDTFAGKTL